MLPLTIFFTLATYIVSKILLEADTIGSTALDQRVFIDKSSQYVLLAFGASAYGSMRERGAVFRTSVEILLLSTCLLIAIVDMSREALIPAGFMLAFYLQRTHYRWKILIWFFACSILLSLVMLRRDLSLADAIQQPLDVLIVYLVEAIGYITAFNIYHFGQVVTEGVDTGFTWLHLVLSVIPLPSSMIGAEILESRNFDAFRPYGASADMLSLSPIVLFVYWTLFGWAARISTRKTGVLRVVLAALLLILFVTSFQYPLRTSSKFFIIVLILLGAHRLLTRRDIRRIGLQYRDYIVQHTAPPRERSHTLNARRTEKAPEFFHGISQSNMRALRFDSQS